MREQILEYLAKTDSASAKDVISSLGKSRAWVFKQLHRLTQEGKIVNENGQYRLAVQISSGKESSPPKVEEPPLVHMEVSNPITYLRRWWQRIIGNEGMNVRFSLRVRPLTAIAMVLVIGGLGFGIGRLSFLAATPVAKYITIPGPSPTPDPWRETAFTGVLRFSDATKRFYLVTGASEAITLELPKNVALAGFVGKRIFATGRYNIRNNILIVTEATDLEVLPTKAVPIPTVTVSALPTLSETPSL